MIRLTDEDNPYPDKPEGWFGSDAEVAIEYYAHQEGFNEGAKAQLKKVVKELRVRGFPVKNSEIIIFTAEDWQSLSRED